MVTKEQAMQIYNLYSQIEKSNEVINVLNQCKENCEEYARGVEIVRDGWGEYRSIQLHIPDGFMNPKSPDPWGGARVYQISLPDAILVLENHVVRLQKALEEEQRKAKEE